MVDFKITKRQKVYEVNNDMAHNYYFLIYGKIYNKEKTRYRKFKYIEWFDIFEVQEFFDKDLITQNDIKEYLNNIECPYIQNIKSYDDNEGLKEFYAFCNDTIREYNKLFK